jgi:hypothetical protein
MLLKARQGLDMADLRLEFSTPLPQSAAGTWPTLTPELAQALPRRARVTGSHGRAT